jgi:hypothetical protein
LADRCGLTVTAGEALPSRRLAHLKKQKRNWLGDGENRHIDPGTPQNWRLKTQLRDPFCVHNFLAEPLGI